MMLQSALTKVEGAISNHELKGLSESSTSVTVIQYNKQQGTSCIKYLQLLLFMPLSANEPLNESALHDQI